MFSVTLLFFLPTFLTCLAFISMLSLTTTGQTLLTVGVRFALTLGVVFMGLIGTAGNLYDGAFDGIDNLGAWRGGVFALNMNGSDKDRSPECSGIGSGNEKLSYSNCGVTCWGV